MTWNIVDILLFVLILLSAVHGWQRGFIQGLLELVIFAGSLLLGLVLYRPVVYWLEPGLDLSPVWLAPLAFIAMTITAGLLLALLGRFLFSRLPANLEERFVNRLLGLGPGLINGFIVAAIIASLLVVAPLTGYWQDAVRQSAAVDRLALYTGRLETVFTPIFGPAFGQTLTMVTVLPESDERLELPGTVADAEPRPKLEKQMLALVNRERARAGLPSLVLDPLLTQVARDHSIDMLAKGYFGHVGPDGKDPFDRLNAAGVFYLAAGENVSLAPTLSIAHNELMNSPGHRANILRTEFGRVGIGIVDGDHLGLMITQLFRN